MAAVTQNNNASFYPPNPRSTMTEDPGNLKPQRPKHQLAGAIGRVLGIATGLTVRELAGFDSFWAWMVLAIGGMFVGQGIAVLLARKIASK
jgi:hypothetical protein